MPIQQGGQSDVLFGGGTQPLAKVWVTWHVQGINMTLMLGCSIHGGLTQSDGMIARRRAQFG